MQCRATCCHAHLHAKHTNNDNWSRMNAKLPFFITAFSHFYSFFVTNATYQGTTEFSGEREYQ